MNANEPEPQFVPPPTRRQRFVMFLKSPLTWRKTWRVTRRWIVYPVLVIALLGTIGECIRQWIISSNRAELDAAMNDVRVQVLQGKTPREFFNSRVKGTNG